MQNSLHVISSLLLYTMSCNQDLQTAEMVFRDEPGGEGGGGLRTVLPEEGDFEVLTDPLVVLHALNSAGCGKTIYYRFCQYTNYSYQ